MAIQCFQCMNYVTLLFTPQRLKVYNKTVQSIVLMLPKASHLSFFHIERYIHYITLIIYLPLENHLALFLKESFQG